MNKLFERIKKRIALTATEACAYRENIRVISEAELKTILEEEFANFVPDINVGDKGWIPVTERLPENNDNVRITVNKFKGLEVAVGWYNHNKEKWKVCPSDDDEFYYCYSSNVVAWKENTDVPYNPESTEKPTQRTNADRIRTMTNEELAYVLMCPYDTAGKTEDIMPCVLDDKDPDFAPHGRCKECTMKWLNREVDSE